MLLLLALSCGAPVPVPARAPDVATASPQVLRLVAVGDTGTADATQRRVATSMRSVCADRGCDLALLLGDNLYPRGMTGPDDPAMDEVMRAFRPLGAPIYGVLGNHDYGRGFDRRKAAWQLAWAVRDPQVVMPAPYYRFEAGPASVWALDTNLVFFWGKTAQGAWLDTSLPAAGGTWRLAMGHHPYLSVGRHGSAGAYEGWRYVPYLSGAALGALFREHLCGRVDVYLSGHDHGLQWHETCGTHWIVSGGGSRATALSDERRGATFAHGGEGFVWLELGPAGLVVAFYDADGAPLHEARRPR